MIKRISPGFQEVQDSFQIRDFLSHHPRFCLPDSWLMYKILQIRQESYMEEIGEESW
jgi:hypothetical protein